MITLVGRETLEVASDGKESTYNARDLGSIPGLGSSPGEGNGYSLQYSALENSMDCIVQGVQRVGHNWVTFTFTFHLFKTLLIQFSVTCSYKQSYILQVVLIENFIWALWSWKTTEIKKFSHALCFKKQLSQKNHFYTHTHTLCLPITRPDTTPLNSLWRSHKWSAKLLIPRINRHKTLVHQIS